MHRSLVALVVLLGLATTACGGGAAARGVDLGDTHGFHGDYLDHPYTVPATVLTDTAGRPYRLDDAAVGRVRLIFFGYTHCPDVCQVVMSTIASAVVRLPESQRRRVEVVFVTTDPKRDTLAALRTYLDHFDPSFEGLTGPIDRLDAAGRPLKVLVKRGAPLPGGGYDVSHGTQVMAAQGNRVHLLWTQGTSPSQLADDLTKLLEGLMPVLPQLTSLFIPSPGRGVWHLGPIPIRAYALCIIAGVIAAIWLGEKRWLARGGRPGQVGDIAIWAVPFGLVGARVYSLFTDSDRYFGAGKAWWEPFAIWHGGIGIWGAIAAGMLGAWIGCRRRGMRLRSLADALAPALLLAQGIGRWGNYFNQELFGRPTTKPWGLEIDPAHRPPGYTQYATFHPTYLYECVWDLGAMGVVLWLDRRFKLGWGRCFALYVMAYCAGRFWIENLRIDTIEHHILGLRLNAWTAIVLFVGAAVYFVVVGRRHPTRELTPYVDGAGVPTGQLSGSDASDGSVSDGSEPAATAQLSGSDDVPPDRP